jgi:hypothetical protein
MTRRMTLLVLALVGLMVLVVTVAPPQQGGGNGSETPTTTPRASSLEPLSDPDAFDVEAQLSTEPGARPKRIEAVLGDRVQITVSGSGPASVALGELRIEQLERDVPARFELLAETPGTYPLVVLEDERRIGTLEIH